MADKGRSSKDRVCVDLVRAERGFCVCINGRRVAGLKPDWRGDNVVQSWNIPRKDVLEAARRKSS